MNDVRTIWAARDVRTIRIIRANQSMIYIQNYIKKQRFFYFATLYQAFLDISIDQNLFTWFICYFLGFLNKSRDSFNLSYNNSKNVVVAHSSLSYKINIKKLSIFRKQLHLRLIEEILHIFNRLTKRSISVFCTKPTSNDLAFYINNYIKVSSRKSFTFITIFSFTRTRHTSWRDSYRFNETTKQNTPTKILQAVFDQKIQIIFDRAFLPFIVQKEIVSKSSKWKLLHENDRFGNMLCQRL